MIFFSPQFVYLCVHIYSECICCYEMLLGRKFTSYLLVLRITLLVYSYTSHLLVLIITLLIYSYTSYLLMLIITLLIYSYTSYLLVLIITLLIYSYTSYLIVLIITLLEQSSLTIWNIYNNIAWLLPPLKSSIVMWSQITQVHLSNIHPLAHILGTCSLVFIFFTVYFKRFM